MLQTEDCGNSPTRAPGVISTSIYYKERRLRLSECFCGVKIFSAKKKQVSSANSLREYLLLLFLGKLTMARARALLRLPSQLLSRPAKSVIVCYA